MRLLCVLLGLCLLNLSSVAFSASFDCAKAVHPAERAICGNAELSKADEQLGATYKTLLNRCPGIPDKTGLRAAQSLWLSQVREQLNTDANGIAQLGSQYRGRNIYLTGLLPQCVVKPEAAAAFVVKSLVDTKLGYEIPFVESTAPDIAQRINDRIFGDLFGVPAPKKLSEGFSGIPEEYRVDTMRPLTNADYSVVRNDGRLLALSLELEGCGAYCESSTSQKLFDARTGRAVHQEDLFTTAGMEKLAVQLKQKRIRRGKSILALGLKDKSIGPDEIETYERCLSEWEEFDAYLWPIEFNGDGKWRFKADNCSAHVNRPEDALDGLDEIYELSALAPYLSPYGRSLLLGEGDVRDTLPVLTCKSSGQFPRSAAGDAIVKVVSGEEQHLLLQADGRLWGWGGHGAGTGKKNYEEQRKPAMVGNDFVQVAAGQSFSAGIRRDGSLWTWGGTYAGHLGDGGLAFEDGGPADQPLPVRIGEHFAAVELSNSTGIALKSDGTVWVWGGEIVGKDQRGVEKYRRTPRQLDSDAQQVGFGRGWLVLKKDGSLWSYGGGEPGRPEGEAGDEPWKIGDGYTRLAVYGADMAYKKDGSLWAWGETLRAVAAPQDNSNLTETRIGDFVSVSLSQPNFVVAVKADGSLWATHSRGESTRFEPVACGFTDAVVVGYAGYSYTLHVLALKQDGTLVGWGSGARNDTQQIFSRTPRTLGSNFLRIMQSGNYFGGLDAHAIAIRADGTVWEWRDPMGEKENLPESEPLKRIDFDRSHP